MLARAVVRIPMRVVNSARLTGEDDVNLIWNVQKVIIITVEILKSASNTD